MNWINLRTADLRAPEYLGSEPIARATWLNVLAYCFEQENGGVISRAATWGTRQWQQIAGVTREEVMAAAPLLTVHGQDIVVWHYPLEKELEVQTKRDQARDAARRRWDAHLVGKPSTRSVGAPKTVNVLPAACGRIASRNAEGEEGKEVVVSVATDASPPPRAPTTTTPKFCSLPPAASPAEGKGLDNAAWLKRLRTEWPRVNIAAELRRAAAYVRNKRGPEATLSQRFFEGEWLPNCDDSPAPVPSENPRASSVKPVEPEPAGWRSHIAETNYGPGGAYEVKTWAELPPDARAYVLKQMAKIASV
jgi:hypothetical protein